jgi:hypothetical protein
MLMPVSGCRYERGKRSRIRAAIVALYTTAAKCAHEYSLTYEILYI